MRARLLTLLLLLASSAAWSQTQTYASIVSSGIKDEGGNLLSSGQLCFQPVSQLTGLPMSYSVTGDGQRSEAPVCGNVVNGVVTAFNLTNSQITTPINACYNATVTDSYGDVIIGSSSLTAKTGYQCVQMSTIWCSVVSGVYTCNFDDYVQTSPGQVDALTPTLEGGTFTTGAPGSAVSCNITVTGQIPSYALNCQLPQGVAGPTGTVTNNTGSLAPSYQVGTPDGRAQAYVTLLPISSGSGIAGAAMDTAGNFYVVATGAAYKYSILTGALEASNTSTFTGTGVPSGLNHSGGGEVCGAYLCIAQANETSGDTFTTQTIVLLNLADLSFHSYIDISAGSCDASAVAYNSVNNTLICASYYAGSGATADVWNFQTTSGAGTRYSSPTLTYSTALPRLQGISYDQVHGSLVGFQDDSGMQNGFFWDINPATGAVTADEFNGGAWPLNGVAPGEMEAGTAAQGILIYPTPAGNFYAAVPGPATISQTLSGTGVQANITNSTPGYHTIANPAYGAAQVTVTPGKVLLQAFGPQSATNAIDAQAANVTLDPINGLLGPGGPGIGTLQSPTLANAYYGWACDGSGNCYGINSAGNMITKYNGSTWAVLDANGSANSSAGVSVLRDLEFSGSQLFVPGANGSNCSGHGSSNYSNATISVFNTTSGLPFVASYALGGGMQFPTGVAMVSSTLALVPDICNSSAMNAYNPSAGWASLGTVSYSYALSGMRGLSYSPSLAGQGPLPAGTVLMGCDLDDVVYMTVTGQVTYSFSPSFSGTTCEGVDATTNAWLQHFLVNPVSFNSGLPTQQYLSQSLGNKIPATHFAVIVGNNGQVGDGGQNPYLGDNTWNGTQTYNGSIVENPTALSGSSNASSNALSFGVWPGACATATGALDTVIAEDMGSLSSSALYFNISGPTQAAWTAAGCTGTFTSFMDITNFTEIDLGSGSSPTVLKVFESPKIYMIGQPDYIGFQFSGTLTNNRLLNWADSANIAVVIPYSFTSTSATSDPVTIQGVTSASHCTFGATSSSAAANYATTYVSAKASNQITITHAAVSGMTYDVYCTSN
jgi:hypothetical protein